MGEMLIPVVNQIAMLFIVAAVGLMLRKKGVFTDQVIKGVNTTVINVTWPCMAVMALLVDYTPEVLDGFLKVMLISIVAMSASCVIGYLVFNRCKDKLRRPVYICLGALPNAGFVGMPIAHALFGEIGVLYMAAFLVGFNLLVWTAGASMYTGFGIKTLKGFLSPGCIGIVIGIALFILKIHLPEPINLAITSIGRLNTPLAMLLMGARMDTLKLSDLADKKMWGATALKLLGMPLLVFAVMKLMGFSGILLTLPVMMIAMPAASVCQMLAERHGGDSKYAATGVSLSTLMCIVTVPLLAFIIG